MGSPVFAVKDILNVEDFEEEALASTPCKSKIWNGYPFCVVKKVTKTKERMSPKGSAAGT